MNLAIMQPYFFPYIGYIQLIDAVDKFVIYDDVNYIRRGWINRNNILCGGRSHLITLQAIGASPNKLIHAVKVGGNQVKLLKTIAQSYGKAPYFSQVYPLLETCLLYEKKELSCFLLKSIQSICTYLGITTELLVSSEIDKNESLKGQKKIIDICKRLDADIYVNAIGGRELYDKESFNEAGIKLLFLETRHISYKQFSSEFIPSLSIIDVMMFNSREDIMNMVRLYNLVD